MRGFTGGFASGGLAGVALVILKLSFSHVFIRTTGPTDLYLILLLERWGVVSCFLFAYWGREQRQRIMLLL